MNDTFFAIVACFSIIAAALMAVLAYRLNEIWANHCAKFADLLDEQNEFLKTMNHEWYEAYVKMVDMKAEAEKHE
jgi:hypothetical protein